MKIIQVSTIEDLKALYPVPASERASIKSVPIAMLDIVKSIYKSEGVAIRIRYRGRRHDRGLRLTTLKRDARGFSVYCNSVGG